MKNCIPLPSDSKDATRWLNDICEQGLSRAIEKAACLRLVSYEIIFLDRLAELFPIVAPELDERIRALKSFPDRLKEFEEAWSSKLFDASASVKQLNDSLTELAAGS